MKNRSAADSPPLLAIVERSGRLESRHRGHVAVVQADPVEGDRLLRAYGDPEVSVFTRSAIKPLQALPLIERGVAERLQLTDRELAVTSASHNGTDEHVGVVEGLLAKGGFSEDDLLCGAHAPFDRQASLAIARSGSKPRRIHNNCSGKHAGFLHLAKDLGVPAKSYLDPESESQRLVRRTVAEMGGLDEDQVADGLDGCGAPTLHMPLIGLARAFCRLANPDLLSPVRARSCRRLLHAISDQPVCLAGTGRLCTVLVESAPRRVYPKNGAEGVYAVGLVREDGAGFGVAVKVEDGHERGYMPVVVEILQSLGLWSRLPTELERFREVPVFNTQKVLVGRVRSALAW